MKFSPMLFEVFNPHSGAVVRVLPTSRRASNLASRINAKNIDSDNPLDGVLVRRVRPMEAGDLMHMRSDGGKLMRNRRWQRSGFWQPTGYDKYTGRKLYWY